MSARTQLYLALAAIVLGGGALLALVVGTSGSVRGHIGDRYELVSSDGGSRRYRSADPPSEVAADIAAEWKPAERLNDPSGYFLRYRDTIVAVTPTEAGGSEIHVDDERRGYARWYPYVGGWWGTYSGGAEGTRGGGPGVGK